MTTADLREVLTLRDRFRAKLAELAEHRGERQALVQTDRGVQIEWMPWEEREMLHEVNRARAELGAPNVDPDVVHRANQLASGHSDYAPKFALYLAEITLAVRWPGHA